MFKSYKFENIFNYNIPYYKISILDIALSLKLKLSQDQAV